MHGQLALAFSEDHTHVRIEVQAVRRDAELLLGHGPRVALGVIDDLLVGRCHVFLRRYLAGPIFSTTVQSLVVRPGA